MRFRLKDSRFLLLRSLFSRFSSLKSFSSALFSHSSTLLHRLSHRSHSQEDTRARPPLGIWVVTTPRADYVVALDDQEGDEQ